MQIPQESAFFNVFVAFSAKMADDFGGSDSGDDYGDVEDADEMEEIEEGGDENADQVR